MPLRATAFVPLLGSFALAAAQPTATPLSPPLAPASSASAVTSTPADPSAAELQAELLALWETDQAGRRKLPEVEKRHGAHSPELRALWAEIAVTDRANLARVRAILDRHGWLGPETVGRRASDTLFLVIQHSDLLTQQHYLPMMRDAVRQGKAQAASLALLEDRVALGEGRPQRYGSQIARDPATGRYYVDKLDDPAGVDARRAAVGLRPMAEYVRTWDIAWDPAGYAREQAERERIPAAPGGPGATDAGSLRATLDAVFASNQGYRPRLAAAEKEFGKDSAQARALRATIAETDAANFATVREILDRHGWVGESAVGARASTALFLVIQQADLATQEKYLPLLREAVRQRQAQPGHLAMLEDRVALQSGRPQRYGTQVTWDAATQTRAIAPLEDPVNVDALRAAVNLPPLAEYARGFGIAWPPPSAK